MLSKLLHALLASSVVVGAALGSGALVKQLPKGDSRNLAEKYLTAPGKVLQEKLEDNKQVRRLLKKSDKALEKGQEKLEDVRDSLGASHVSVWAFVGFVLCFLGTLAFGVSSFKSALILGVKVTIAMLCLQGALVFAGILAYQKLAG